MYGRRQSNGHGGDNKTQLFVRLSEQRMNIRTTKFHLTLKQCNYVSLKIATSVYKHEYYDSKTAELSKQLVQR